MRDERLIKDRYIISFNIKTNRWNIKHKLNKTTIFSFKTEQRANNFIDKLFNFPFKNNNDEK